jgi:type II secretory pathway component PulF
LYFLAKIIPRNGAIRKGFDFVILIIPLLGKALRNFAYGSYCKAFNMLYASGIPITMAAELAPDLAGNAYIGGLFLKASQSVQHGQPMFKGLSNAIPAEMRHMWMVGEESGQLDDVTEKLGKTYFDKAKFNFDLVTFWYPKIFYFGVMLYMIKLAADGFAVATSM